MAVHMRQTEKDLSSFMPDKGNSNMAASVEVFAQNKPIEVQVCAVYGYTLKYSCLQQEPTSIINLVTYVLLHRSKY